MRLIIVLMVLVALVGCSLSPDAEQVSKYTSQEALAIVEAGWKIGGSIVIAAIIRAIFH